MNEKIIRRYCRRVNRELICSRSRRKQLLDGLKQELREKFCSESVTLQEVIAEIGAPLTVAQQLLEPVDLVEWHTLVKRRLRLPIFLTVIAVISIVASTMVYRKYKESCDVTITSVKTIIVYDGADATGIPEDDEMIWSPVVYAYND